MDYGDRKAAGAVEDSVQGETVDILAATTRSLVAIGAAAALNCHVCLRHLIPAALNNGILAEEVAGALGVAQEIRARAGAMTDELGAALVERRPTGTGPATNCCQE